jgi:hypothetical protein
MHVPVVRVSEVRVAVVAGMVVRGVLVSGVRVIVRAAIAARMIVGRISHGVYFTHSPGRALRAGVSGKFDTFEPRFH